MIYRCPDCRTRRSTPALMRAHQTAHEHTWCLCPGPAWSAALGKHRLGTPGCYGRDDLQRAADLAWDTVGDTAQECPF